MRLPLLLFVEALAIAATLGWVIFGIDPLPNAAGLPHLVHTPMFRGGPGFERMQPFLLEAWLLGSLGVAFFSTCFALGVQRRDQRTLLLISVAALLYEIAWSGLLALYWFYARDLPDTLFLGFPAPTAWLFFVFTPAPVLFLAIYLFRFDSFMPPDSALEALHTARSKRDPSETP